MAGHTLLAANPSNMHCSNTRTGLWALLPALISFLPLHQAVAQRVCGTMEYLQEQIAADPGRGLRLQQADDHAAAYALSSAAQQERSVVVIPVVVHVVWNTSGENVSDARIIAQVQQLNDDFARMNSDANETPAAFAGLAANTDIQFCLAQRDPNGNATNGIERRQTSVTSFSSNDNVKRYNNGGLDAWPRDSYLNLWSCDLGSGLLGYAQFPGGAASTDGVVVDYSTVGSLTVPGTGGSFKYGRSATHEVGHWMNLRHIWGDDGSGCNGSDQVADTPNQADETYGCPTFPRVSCSNGPNGDMFMNYMDYSDDQCMNLFTDGQADRMQSVFSPGGARQALTGSLGCTAPGGGSCGTPGNTSANVTGASTATLAWNAVSGATSYSYRFRTQGSGTWTTASTGAASANLSGLAAGETYEWQVAANCSNGSTSAYSALATFSMGSASCSDPYEPNNTAGTATSINANTDYHALIGVKKDKDWFEFANSVSQPNFRVTLSGLPGDYDLQVKRGSTVIGNSTNGGTTAEEVVYNGSTVGTYRIRVLGYGGAYDPDGCYTLRASTSASDFRTAGPGPEAGIGLKSNLQLFPNPASETLTVRFEAQQDGVVELSVIDALGRPVLSRQITAVDGSSNLVLDVGDWQNGMYVVRMVDQGLESHQRLLIAR